jgi:hypothetical protein
MRIMNIAWITIGLEVYRPGAERSERLEISSVVWGRRRSQIIFASTGSSLSSLTLGARRN